MISTGVLTVAAFSMVPLASGETVAETLKVTELYGPKVIVSLMLPDPLPVQDEPKPAVHDQEMPVSASGKLSATTISGTVIEVGFLTTME